MRNKNKDIFAEPCWRRIKILDGMLRLAVMFSSFKDRDNWP